MKYVQIIFFLFVSYYVTAQNTHYVAVNGNDDNPGTFDQPWGTWNKAFAEAQPGDTVYFRGGVYMSKKRIELNPKSWPNGIGFSGRHDGIITYSSYPGEWAILDCSQHVDTYGMWKGIYNYGISMSFVEYIHLKNFEIRNVFQLDRIVTGIINTSDCCNLTFEHIILHNSGNRGFYINGGVWNPWDGADPDKIEPPGYWGYASEYHDTTRFINCDVYDLMDTLSSCSTCAPGNAADPWKTVHYAGNYVSWEGCRAWNYSDDAWDPTGFGAIRVFDNCWVMASNKYYDPKASWITERNGLKNTASRPNDYKYFYDRSINFLTIKHCLAVFSTVGFLELDWYSRNNSLYYNNTSYANGINFDGTTCDEDNPTRKYNVYRNNVAYGATTNHPGVGIPYNVRLVGDQYIESNNTWDYNPAIWMPTDTVSLSNSDFTSVDSLTIVALFTAPRNADGSLPSIKPLTLSASSDLIDAGKDVGMAYNGAAPDIGAFEYDKVPGTNNKYPSVIITYPSNGSQFKIPCSITINTYVNDKDGSVSKVEFYNGSTKIGEAISSPWIFEYGSVPIGYHSIRAVVTDNQGAKATSSVIKITVIPENFNRSDYIGLLFPNPNYGSFTVFLPPQLEKISSIQILSLNGKVMHTDIILPSENLKKLDLSFLKPGLYIYIISSNEILLTGKFIKL